MTGRSTSLGLRTALAWLLATQAPLLVSCGSRQRPEQPEQTEPAGEAAGPADSAKVHAPPDQAKAVPPETANERIAADILRTANTIAIRSARLARARSTSDAIQAYAVQIVEDHGGANARLGEVTQELGLRPEPNATSRALTEQADRARATFETKRGETFDRAYIDNEIAFHRQVLGLLDRQLIPAAEDSSMRALLQDQRSAMEAHLDHANHVRAALGP